MAIPKKVRERIVAGLKNYLPIIDQQKARDVSEADTVTLVKDIMADVLGYDKYAELTGEYAIRGTYCDLAVKFDTKLVLLCEVKAIGISLDDKHVKQAVDYAANQGCDWVILTNAGIWRLYNVTFGKPIDKKLIVELDLAAINTRTDRDMECLYAFTKEGITKGAHVALKDLHEATSRHLIGALLVENDKIVNVIKRELKRVVEATIDEATIKRVLTEEIFKRDIVDGPEWKEAVQRVNRKEGKALRTRRSKPKKAEATGDPLPPATADIQLPSQSP